MGPAAVAELYSPPRVTAALPRPVCGQQLHRSELVAGSTFDLHADVDGVAWDFSKPGDRKRAIARIRAEEPFLVVGSPPCTMFSRLNVNLNSHKVGKVEWDERWRAAVVLLTFAAVVYKIQVLAGRHFLHEHPAGATSWTHPAIVQLGAREGVGAVVAHQCQFGLETTGADGGRAPAMKPTRFMSSSPAVLEALSRRCLGGHAHAPLLGGTRARDAAVYPPGLCEAIAQGAAEQLRRDKRASVLDIAAASASSLAPILDTRAFIAAAERGGREVNCDDAQDRTKDESEELATWAAKEVYDEITGATLPPKLVQQARAEEIKFMLDGASGSAPSSQTAGPRLGRRPSAASGWTSTRATRPSP